MSTDRISGKVARILSSRELVINVGSNHGVQPGMKFDVLQPHGENILDPDTGEVLGSVEVPKVRVQVVDVQEKMSVASTFRTYTENVGGDGGFGVFGVDNSLKRLLEPPKVVTKFETLRTTEAKALTLSDKDSYVKTGDPVVQVVRNELTVPK